MVKKKIFRLILFLTLMFTLVLWRKADAVEGSIKSLKASIESTLSDHIAEVTLDYSLEIKENTKYIPLSALIFSNTTIESLEASSNGIHCPVTLDQSNATSISGFINLPESLEMGEEMTLVINYCVPGSVYLHENNFELMVPIVVVDWKPERAIINVFEATINVPDKVFVEEHFPSTPITSEFNENIMTMSLQLQAIPSLIRVKGKIGEPTYFTFTRKVDLTILFILLIFCFLIGIRFFKKKRERVS